ncbi:MAG: ATP-binding cassette domain-containing protein [Terriglobales bacterium]|jgi:ABC-type lipoprotein export system ATPase subunit
MPTSHVLEPPVAVPNRKIHTITILGGQGKNRLLEPLRQVDLKMGDIVSVVGPTGCGKTTLINDIELYANGNTPTGRTVLINGEPLPDDYLSDPSSNPIALISQHTNFLSDLPVNVFLETHARIRGVASPERAVGETVNFANQLTGEPIILENAMTELSGGQTRSLLIADAIVIGNSPIILLDEIENAGIHRTRALEMLKGYEKIFIFVTHDPRIALLSDYRIVMRDGAMQKVIVTKDEEKGVAQEIRKLDDLLLGLRQRIRIGEELNLVELHERLRELGYVA